MATETVITREAPEIEAYKLGLMEQAKALTSAPPTGGQPAITSQGMTQAQTDALNAASTGLGGYQSYLTDAGTTQGLGLAALKGSMGAPTANQMASYMNPYQQAIQDEITRAFDMQRSQMGQQAAQAGAFGGSRAAVQQAEIGRNEAAALAKSQADNFLQAQAAAQNELGRNLAGGQALGQLGLQQAGIGELATKLGIADQSNLFSLGEQQRGILQAGDEATRQTQMAKIFEPYQRLGFYGDVLRGAPTSQSTITQSAAPNPSILNQLIGAGIGGLSLYGAAGKAFS
jgi:hypothetical protein